MIRGPPNHSVGIEENQRFALLGRLGGCATAHPFAVCIHVHVPAKIIGSSHSNTASEGSRERFSAGSASRKENKRPRRSIITLAPASALSRTSEKCCRARATEYRFILYIVHDLAVSAKIRIVRPPWG